MALTTAEIQAAYVTFFNRPADVEGLNYWSSYAGSVADLYATLATSTEYSGVFSGLTQSAQVNTVYQNLFGREAEAEGLNYWVGELASGKITLANLALAVAKGAKTTDLATYENREKAATAFTKELVGDTAKILAYQGAGANAVAKEWLSSVKDTTASLEAAVAPSAIDAAVKSMTGAANGGTFTLTTGVDTFTGGAGNDIFNASNAVGAGNTATLNSLDVLDGGAGQDTLNIVGQAFPTAATIKNIETLNIANDGGSVVVDAGKYGFDTVNATAGGTGANGVTVTNGKVVNVLGSEGNTGVAISGAELSTVSVANVKGTGTVAVNNLTAAGANATTLTTVSLENLSNTGGATTLVGDAIATVSLKGQKAASTVTMTNAVSTALALNVDGVGYNAAGSAVAVTLNAGAKAANVTVNATGSKSNVTVAATAAKTLTLTGTADLTLAGISGAALKSIDGSAATGGLTLGTLNSGTADVKTGAGKDSFTVNAAKVVVDSGAGNDTVTLNSALAIGSTVNLGAGDDVLLASGPGAVTAATASGTVVIDGGDGIDTLAASLVNATNAKQFVNFERIDASAGTTTLDVELMTGSTIGGVTLNGGNGAVTLQNLAAGAGLTVAGGTNLGSLTVGVKGAAANTADTFGITFAGQAAASATAALPTAISATAVGLEGVEAVTIASSGTGFVANTLSLAANTKLKTIEITGDKALNLSFTVANGTTGATTGVSSIDGSTATGALNIDLANVNGVTAGVSVKGGSAADTFTTKVGESVSLTGGAGNDKFIVTSTVAGATAAATAKMVTIADFQAGDTITGLVAAGDIAKITLIAAVQNLDQAFALLGDNTGNNDVQWFNYGSDTYVVFNDATAALSAGDVVVKLTGTIDLSNATIAAGVVGLA